MAVLLALSSAATFGIGDFLGGLAARRTAAAAVLLWSHAVGLLLLLASTTVVTGVLSGRDLAIGGIGGVAGAVGVGLLYQALSIGPMSAIAPVTALLAAAVPVVVGVASGERPGLLTIAGMVLALTAVVLVSAEGGGSFRPADPRGVTYALGAGLGFGLFFVALSATDDGSGLWPLVGARTTSVAVVGSLALGRRFDPTVTRGAPRWQTVGAGVLDAGANVLYLLAIREGLLSVVSVLSSLYPVSTVVLAWVVLRERFAPLQRAGLVIAVPAAILVAL